LFRQQPKLIGMKPRRPKGERTRLIFLLELAIVLPAAALVVLGALHLRSIQRERSVEAAIQRDFSQVLAISAKHINMKARDLMDEVRAHFPEPELACNQSLDQLLTEYPYIAHVFIYTDHGLIVRSQPKRLQDAGFRDEAADFANTVPMFAMNRDSYVEELVHGEAKGMIYIPTTNWAIRGTQHMIYQPVVMFVVKDSKTGKATLAGMGFDADYIRDKFFPQMLDEAVSQNLAEGDNGKNRTTVMVHVKSDADPLAASAGWDGGTPEVEREIGGFFPPLSLAMKIQGTTTAAIAERFMRTSFLTLTVLSLLLAGGIYLTHRNVSKELALARLKSDFVSNVSHELRTPLSLIRLYAETLELGRISSPEKYQEYYQTIRKESERLTGLINNILDFSRIEAGRKEYDFRETNLQELVRNTLESYRYQIEQSGFTFEEQIDDKVPPLKVDRESIARSLLNLVNNALKYSQDRKYIGVSLYRQQSSVKLEVVDHGIGIPPEEQPKIFDKFYRVGDPLVHNTKGSGLGLSLVKHIVKAHGGDVAVDSEPGRGSRFIITLPLNMEGQTA
jgi:signal transduction histidine kinase